MAYKRILLRRDTAATWTSANSILASGEIGYETDTGRFKIGNASTAWTSLAYSVTTNLAASVLNDLGDVTITSAADGDFLRWNGTAWINDAVNLSTDTIGSFVQSLVAGTGVTLSGNSGENATPTINVDTTVIQARVTNITDTEIGYLDGVTSGIQTQINLKAPLASPTFTGTPTLPTGTIATTQTASNNTTAVATTAYVDTADALKANLASPTFTGTPTLPTGTIATTQSAADSTTKVATTAFVTTADNLKANLASPTFTGTPTLPTGTIATTQSTGNNTTAVATTAFVTTAITNITPSTTVLDGGTPETLQFYVMGAVDAGVVV